MSWKDDSGIAIDNSIGQRKGSFGVHALKEDVVKTN